MVEHQNVDLVLKLAESIDLNAKDRHGSTPLHYAALIGNREIARILIQAGARINPQVLLPFFSFFFSSPFFSFLFFSFSFYFF